MVSLQSHDVASSGTSWINTTSALPVCGQPVEFMLAERECPIVGVYSEDGFRSRWTRYAPQLVCRWRGAITHEQPSGDIFVSAISPS
jgi:hypothetical protein